MSGVEDKRKHTKVNYLLFNYFNRMMICGTKIPVMKKNMLVVTQM